ncbi:MAG: hypothetical protein RugAbin2_01307 [Rugosibacter sp.]|jgi:hypothetical protein|nr:hypothetical protein [Rugosibacter sp.]
MLAARLQSSWKVSYGAAVKKTSHREAASRAAMGTLFAINWHSSRLLFCIAPFIVTRQLLIYLLSLPFNPLDMEFPYGHTTR